MHFPTLSAMKQHFTITDSSFKTQQKNHSSNLHFTEYSIAKIYGMTIEVPVQFVIAVSSIGTWSSNIGRLYNLAAYSCYSTGIGRVTKYNDIKKSKILFRKKSNLQKYINVIKLYRDRAAPP